MDVQAAGCACRHKDIVSKDTNGLFNFPETDFVSLEFPRREFKTNIVVLFRDKPVNHESRFSLHAPDCVLVILVQ